jgi:hypothetical protein
MARPIIGAVVQIPRADGLITYAVRISAYGERHLVTLGTRKMAGRGPEPNDNAIASPRRSRPACGSGPHASRLRSPGPATRLLPDCPRGRNGLPEAQDPGPG